MLNIICKFAPSYYTRKTLYPAVHNDYIKF